MDPNLVNSPRKHIKEVKVVFTNPSNTFSIAIIVYDNVNRVGIRWNGEKDEKGYPQTFGRPTWFLLPKAVALAYAEKINNEQLKFTINQAIDDEM